VKRRFAAPANVRIGTVGFCLFALCASALADTQLPYPKGVKRLPRSIQPVVAAQKPVYPDEARRARMTGTGVFWLYLDKNTGRVTKIKVAKSTGHDILDQAAATALVHWRFQSGIDGMVVPVEFTMNGRVTVEPGAH
jgi:TonB family protein